MSTRKVHKPHNNKTWIISVSLIILFVIVGGYFVNAHIQKQHAEESHQAYVYAMSNLLQTSKKEEISARQTLQDKINYATDLANKSQGKIFDTSLPNVQNQLASANISISTATPTSNDYHDYVKTRNILTQASNSLQERIEPLEQSYSAWESSRTTLDQQAQTTQSEIDQATSGFGDLETQIKNNSGKLEETEADRKIRIEEAKKQKAREEAARNTPKPTPVKPTPSAPVTTPPVEPSVEPTVAPSVEPTPTPVPTTEAPTDTSVPTE